MAEYLVFEVQGPMDRRALDVHVVQGAGELVVSKFVIGVHNGKEAQVAQIDSPFGGTLVPNLGRLLDTPSLDSSVHDTEQVIEMINGFLAVTDRASVNLSGTNVGDIPDELYEGLPAEIQKNIKRLRLADRPAPGRYL